MKKIKFLGLAALGSATILGLASCGDNTTKPDESFGFGAAFAYVGKIKLIAATNTIKIFVIRINILITSKIFLLPLNYSV